MKENSVDFVKSEDELTEICQEIVRAAFDGQSPALPARWNGFVQEFVNMFSSMLPYFTVKEAEVSFGIYFSNEIKRMVESMDKLGVGQDVRNHPVIQKILSRLI